MEDQILQHFLVFNRPNAQALGNSGVIVLPYSSFNHDRPKKHSTLELDEFERHGDSKFAYLGKNIDNKKNGKLASPTIPPSQRCICAFAMKYDQRFSTLYILRDVAVGYPWQGCLSYVLRTLYNSAFLQNCYSRKAFRDRDLLYRKSERQHGNLFSEGIRPCRGNVLCINSRVSSFVVVVVGGWNGG